MFAGPGRVRIKGTSRIYASSPINALAVDPPFDRFIFCEKESERIAILEQRCREHPDRDIHFIPGDANENAEKILDLIPRASRGHGVLSLCFVDPYNMRSLHFSTLEALKERWVDFLVLIPSEMDAQRAEHVYVAPGNDVVGRFLGNQDWRLEWQKAQNEMRFEQFVVEEFGRSMARIGKIKPDISTTWQMKNTVNRVLYRLVLYSRSEVAGKFWREAQRYMNPNLTFPGF